MAKDYDASAIEVLSGLEPVRRRPGMYTDTSRPNHLAHEVIDNSVDEALSGHAQQIDVTLYKDGSVEVKDDGRGMPVDIHPKEKVSGVELILTRLHAGGKFDSGSYGFSVACTVSACRWSMRSRASSSAGCAAAARNTTSGFATARSSRI